jgi:hypothetical protein
MDNHYVIEQMIRDRLAAARASARRTALIRQSKGRPRRSSGIGHRLIDLGRPLVKVARDAARTVGWRIRRRRALPAGAPVARAHLKGE